MNQAKIRQLKLYCILDMALNNKNLYYPIMDEIDFQITLNYCRENNLLNRNGIITKKGIKVRIQLTKELKLKGIYQSIYPIFTMLHASNIVQNDIYLP